MAQIQREWVRITADPLFLTLGLRLNGVEGLEFLTVDCPNDWDDVKKPTKKVLLFEGRRFTFCSWNSDRNVANFNRRLDSDPAVSRIL